MALPNVTAAAATGTLTSGGANLVRVSHSATGEAGNFISLEAGTRLPKLMSDLIGFAPSFGAFLSR